MSRLLGPSLLVVLLIDASIAFADCEPYPLGDEIRETETIVEATLITIDDNAARFRIDRVFKGRIGREVSLPIHRRFFVSETQRGQRFVLFLRRQETGAFSVGSCGSSGSARVDEILTQVRSSGLTPHAPMNTVR